MIEVKDRIPTYPGRVKMTPVAGQENTFDMVRADSPVEVGTPLNKALFDSIRNDVVGLQNDMDNVQETMVVMTNEQIRTICT